jgi:hypothetical protein
MVFTVSTSSGGRISHGCRVYRICYVKWVFFVVTEHLPFTEDRFLLRLTFIYRGYTDIDIDVPTPVCICDFTNVYHDPMTISSL